jgi:hypothetical protein
MIVSPYPSHASGIDMVRHNVAVICELFLAEGAEAILCNDLPIEEIPHFTVGAEFPEPPGMKRIFDAPNTHLAHALFSRDCLSSTAETGAVDRAELVLAESHDVLQIGLGAMV